MSRPQRRLPGSVLLALGFAIHLSLGAPSQSNAQGVVLSQPADAPGRVRIEVDGELFTEYRFQDTSRPYLYPVLGPGGIPMSRAWPIEKGEGEQHDHVHHRSLWWTHGSVNGVDFWSEGAKAGKTVHREFRELKSGPDIGTLVAVNDLITQEGKHVATAEFTIRVHRRSGFRLMDFEVNLEATDGEIRLGDTKEGTMAIRLAESMRLEPNSFHRGEATGHIVNSEGVRDGDTWGKRARWVDYFGPVQGQTMGVAIFDHPSNPRHPTWWHVRDYGLFAANPFGVHDFEKKPAGTGDMTIPAGGHATFRYRFLFHRGDEVAGQVARRYEEYTHE